MRTIVDLQAVSDRVLDVAPLHAAARPRPSRPRDMALVMAMVLISAAGSVGGLGLWVAGLPGAGGRLFCGAVGVLLALLRVR